MADWTALSNTAVGVGGLPSGATVTALRDNPIAIAEGAVGAPRIVDGALGTTVLAAGQNWVDARLRNTTVLARTATGATAGAVGAYALCRKISVGDTFAGGTISASSLEYANSEGGISGLIARPKPSGTWRCMGFSDDVSPEGATTLWLRIS